MTAPNEERLKRWRLVLGGEDAEGTGCSLAGADLVVLAAPLSATLGLLDQIGPHLAPGALVTDVASLKAKLAVADARSTRSVA